MGLHRNSVAGGRPRATRPAGRIRRRLPMLAGPASILAVAAFLVAPSPSALALTTFSAPLMGWTSWGVESSTNPDYGGGWLTEQNIKNAANALASNLKSAGYDYVDIDSFWSNGYDGNGIPTADPSRFPDGMASLAAYIHGLGLKIGLYTTVGLAQSVYSANDPILGTDCTTQQIAVQPLTPTNGWGGAWKIDYANPCAQAYINSIVAQFASWGVDMLKVDGITAANVPDVRAFAKAIQVAGRPMWLSASAWPVPVSIASALRPYANSVRTDTDSECYCNTVATWDNSVAARWADLPAWLPHLSRNYLPDLDAMPISNNTGIGIQDGLSDTQRQSVMNFWSMASSPLYVGGDIYFIDASAVSILTNPEVIAVDHSRVFPRQLTGGTDQVWTKKVGSARYVAVYNLGSSTTNITVSWSQLGISGTRSVRDVDARANLGQFSGSWTAANVPADGSRLIKVT